ncbi:MAG TPA: glycerate kinase [Sphingobacteriaceae bacterium]|nr:glycerate kinase [Sphingobacteriaceae bacterium]
MNILIAPNAFKHSLPASEIAEAIKSGFEDSNLESDYLLFPIADGGEGITDILIKKLKGRLEHVKVSDALGREIATSFGIIANDTAVIELASASGLKWLKNADLNPLITSSFGTGQLILKALDSGLRKFVIGLGNSATVDGGVGILQALGVKFLNVNHQEIGLGGAQLAHITQVDCSGIDIRLKDCHIKVACDVENKLLGESGAARVFAPQKGASEKMVVILENALTNFNRITKQDLGKDMSDLLHGGAAGGVAASLAIFLNAELVSGAGYLLQLTGFEEALSKSDLLVTAEGGLDEQTLAGKGPYGAAKLAKQKGLPVIVFAGQIPYNLDLSKFEYFDAVFSIGTGPVTLDEALKNTAQNLRRTACQVGKMLKLKLNTD